MDNFQQHEMKLQRAHPSTTSGTLNTREWVMLSKQENQHVCIRTVLIVIGKVARKWASAVKSVFVSLG